MNRGTRRSCSLLVPARFSRNVVKEGRVAFDDCSHRSHLLVSEGVVLVSSCASAPGQYLTTLYSSKR